MKTVKNILTENRKSIISSIKWIFKIYKMEDIKKQMVNFLEWAKKNEDLIFDADTKRNTKTLLKGFIQKMANEQTLQFNIEKYGVARPKLRDIMGAISLREEEKGNVWHPVYKEWVPNSNPQASMQI